MHVQFLILVFGLNLHAVTAYGNGLVSEACMSMTPGHSNNVNSTLEPPYTVTSSASSYTDGQVITVTLQANGTGFKGFLLQARDEKDDKGPVGTFTLMGNNSQLLNCSAIEGSAVSHNSKDEKSTIVAQWKAPSSTNTDIRFRATFVQNLNNYWVGVESDPVRFLSTNATVSPPNVTVSTTDATVGINHTTVSTTGATVGITHSTVSTTGATVGINHTTVSTTGATVGITHSTVITTTDDSSSMSLTLCLLLLPMLAII